MISLTINDTPVSVPEGTTIIEAAERTQVTIPRLCTMECLEPYGACRVCSVEIENEARLSPSCTRPVAEGMVVRTNTRRVRQARKMIVELLMASHVADCKSCLRSGSCELLKLARQVGITETRFEPATTRFAVDKSSPSIARDPNKCVLCGRCIRVCSEVQTVSAIGFVNRGKNTRVSTYEEQGLGQVQCTNCGQCIHVCPVGALRERSAVEQVWDAIADPAVHTVVQVAPAVRVSVGEMLGMEVGTLTTGKMHAAMRRLGFDRVFDTNFAADLTIMEEGSELLERIGKGGPLPLITSCSPGWVKFMEHFYPDVRDHVSTCKSPQQMFGALVKTYYAERAGIDPATIRSISIMPCTAKKYEAQRPEMCDSGFQDVDYVLTTREFCQMIAESGINFPGLPEEDPEPLMGMYTGAATIFGATGGVMEAAIRTVHKLVTGEELEQVDFMPARGIEGVREAAVQLNGTTVRVAVAHGLGNARKLMQQLREGNSPYHFIEIMACPGGCVGGGGQPLGFKMPTRARRAEGLYAEDAKMPRRCSHENPAVKELYDSFLGAPLGERSHHLLHTHYVARNAF